MKMLISAVVSRVALQHRRDMSSCCLVSWVTHRISTFHSISDVSCVPFPCFALHSIEMFDFPRSHRVFDTNIHILMLYLHCHHRRSINSGMIRTFSNRFCWKYSHFPAYTWFHTLAQIIFISINGLSFGSISLKLNGITAGLLPFTFRAEKILYGSNQILWSD